MRSGPEDGVALRALHRVDERLAELHPPFQPDVICPDARHLHNHDAASIGCRRTDRFRVS